MKIQKVRDVKTPTRGTSKSAGLDFYIPNDYHTVELYPQTSENVPSGIKVEIPEGYSLIAFNKSGLALQGLQVGAVVVDEDYQGELHLHVTNIGFRSVMLEPGMKLVQFLLLPVLYEQVELVEYFLKKESERKEGGFGSTGKY